MATALIPALQLLKVNDPLPIVGFEKLDAIPKPTIASLTRRAYQTAIEKNYSKQFFLRGTLYRIRCQTMEMANLGKAHEGQNQNIGQYRDGTLFQYNYFKPYYNRECKVERENVGEALDSIGKLHDILVSNGIDMVFVMATDKVQFTHKPISSPPSFFFEKSHDEFQTTYGQLLSDYGIPFFDTYSFLTNEAPKHAEPMFPYAGTHWNALASSLVVDELLSRLNTSAAKPYSINRFARLEETFEQKGRFADNDIGRLLNLFHNPYLKKNKCYIPIFENEDFTPNEGSVILFGDSFSQMLRKSMAMAKDFAPGKILLCDKRVPSKNELNRIVPDLRLVIFEYMTPNMLCLDKDQRVGGKIPPFCELLKKHLEAWRQADSDGERPRKTGLQE